MKYRTIVKVMGNDYQWDKATYETHSREEAVAIQDRESHIMIGLLNGGHIKDYKIEVVKG